MGNSCNKDLGTDNHTVKDNDESLARFEAFLSFLIDRKNKKAVIGASKHAAVAGGGAIIGGIVAGPPGAFVGASIGNVVGFMSSDHYDGIVVLKEMDDKEKRAFMIKVISLMSARIGTESILNVQSMVEHLCILWKDEAFRKEINEAIALFHKK
mmetsp:Transcript_64646/g.75860  ORF Transcript_64646/g.75860 Transcript_64646/m.75860 type:complete len:154 (-) Transcript_64646:174-635(-)